MNQSALRQGSQQTTIDGNSGILRHSDWRVERITRIYGETNHSGRGIGDGRGVGVLRVLPQNNFEKQKQNYEFW